jgi:hypothetical protein
VPDDPFKFLSDSKITFDEEGMKTFFKTRYETTREVLHQFIVGYREALGREVKPRSPSEINGFVSGDTWDSKIKQFAERTRKWRDEFSDVSKVSEEDLKK